MSQLEVLPGTQNEFASSQVRKFASFHKKELFTTHFYLQGRSTTKYAVTSWLSIRLDYIRLD